MKIQKHLSKKRESKTDYKYVIVLPAEIIKKSGLKEGDELKAVAKKGKIELRRGK